MERQNKKKLTKRAEKFVEEMANPEVKSQTEAYQKAYGCSYDTARANAPKLLANTSISDAIVVRKERALAHHKVTTEEVLGAAVFNMRSSIDDALDENGCFDINKARATGVIDVIKKYKETITTNEQGETRRVVEFEIESPAAARKEVANYIGLEKFPQLPSKPFTDEDIAKELFQRLIDRRGWTEEAALEGVRQEFPAIDVKQLLDVD